MQLQSNCWCSYKVTKLCKSVFEEMRVLQIREHLRCWGPAGTWPSTCASWRKAEAAGRAHPTRHADRAGRALPRAVRAGGPWSCSPAGREQLARNTSSAYRFGRGTVREIDGAVCVADRTRSYVAGAGIADSWTACSRVGRTATGITYSPFMASGLSGMVSILIRREWRGEDGRRCVGGIEVVRSRARIPRLATPELSSAASAPLWRISS